MSMVCQKNARMRDYDFEYRATSRDTYSAIEEVSELILIAIDSVDVQ